MVKVIVGVLQLSVAVGAVQVTTAQLSTAKAVVTVMLAGQPEKTGGVVSVSQGLPHVVGVPLKPIQISAWSMLGFAGNSLILIAGLVGCETIDHENQPVPPNFATSGTWSAAPIPT